MDNKTEKSILREIFDWIILSVIVVLAASIVHSQLFALSEGQSNDSRHFGLIVRSWVEGKAIFRIYPFNKTGVVK